MPPTAPTSGASQDQDGRDALDGKKPLRAFPSPSIASLPLGSLWELVHLSTRDFANEKLSLGKLQGNRSESAASRSHES